MERMTTRIETALVFGLFTGVALMAAGAAFGHEDPKLIPDGNDPVVRWYQPPGSPIVDDWDIEVTPYEDPDAAPVITQAQAVPDQSCWSVELDSDEPLRVRVRAVQDGAVSSWSAYTVVPEPTTSLGLALAVPLLLAVARRRSRSIARARTNGLRS